MVTSKCLYVGYLCSSVAADIERAQIYQSFTVNRECQIPAVREMQIEMKLKYCC